MGTIYDFLMNMDTFYYFLIGILLFTMLVEISSLNIPGANGAMWLGVHFFAFIASFFYVIYIFFVEDLSSARYTLLYTKWSFTLFYHNNFCSAHNWKEEYGITKKTFSFLSFPLIKNSKPNRWLIQTSKLNPMFFKSFDIQTITFF